MKITPEECAELSKYTGEIAISERTPDEQGMVFVTFWRGKGCCQRRLPKRIANLLVSLPSILTLVAEQSDTVKLYNELLYAEGRKYEGESRHDTALR